MLAQKKPVVSYVLFSSQSEYELHHFEAPKINCKFYYPEKTEILFIKHKSNPARTALIIEQIDSSYFISDQIILIKEITKESMFWNNGTLRHVRYFDKEQKIGTWSYWDSSGNLKFTYQFKKGKKCTVKQYYPEGKVHALMQIDGEKSISEQNYFFENGQLMRSGKRFVPSLKKLNTTIKSIQIGNWKYWHSNGRLMQKGSFNNGKKNGVWKFYTKEGVLKQKVRYKNGEVIKQSSIDK